MQIILFCTFAFIFSLLFTWQTRSYVIRKGILDIPNERSSHVIPTPRGGGIAIVCTFTLCILYLAWIKAINPALVWAIVGGGLAIAAVGFCDDIHSISAKWRIVLHFLAAGWVLYCLGGFPILTIGETTIVSPINHIIALIVIVACINFYNFMDGIDGLAGSEGIFVAVISGIALWLSGASQFALILWLLAASIAGFTFWNWPPAKIFLGDVGSGYLGFLFAVLGFYTAKKIMLPITFWGIILAVFLCDATFTLLYRIYQGKKWYQSHREHAYQCLVSKGLTHQSVTLSILALNIFLLMPIAFIVIYNPSQTLWLLGGVTICLFCIWGWIKFNYKF